MHCRGLGSLRGQSVTRHPAACRCHRGHRFLLAASGITAVSCSPLPTAAARSALERSTLSKSYHLQIRKKPCCGRGRASCPQSPSLSLLHLFPVEVRDVRNEGMKVWLPQPTRLKGWEFLRGQGIWEGLCNCSSSRIPSGSGKSCHSGRSVFSRNSCCSCSCTSHLLFTLFL